VFNSTGSRIWRRACTGGRSAPGEPACRGARVKNGDPSLCRGHSKVAAHKDQLAWQIERSRDAENEGKPERDERVEGSQRRSSRSAEGTWGLRRRSRSYSVCPSPARGMDGHHLPSGSGRSPVDSLWISLLVKNKPLHGVTRSTVGSCLATSSPVRGRDPDAAFSMAARRARADAYPCIVVNGRFLESLLKSLTNSSDALRFRIG